MHCQRRQQLTEQPRVICQSQGHLTSPLILHLLSTPCFQSEVSATRISPAAIKGHRLSPQTLTFLSTSATFPTTTFASCFSIIRPYSKFNHRKKLNHQRGYFIAFKFKHSFAKEGRDR